MTKVMEKEGEMIPKVIPKLGKHSKVRKDPPSSSLVELLRLSLHKGKCAPPLHEDVAKGKKLRLGGPHTLHAPLGYGKML
jgi:hypothetical protein